jgi:hypothetical protein
MHNRGQKEVRVITFHVLSPLRTCIWQKERRLLVVVRLISFLSFVTTSLDSPLDSLQWVTSSLSTTLLSTMEKEVKEVHENNKERCEERGHGKEPSLSKNVSRSFQAWLTNWKIPYYWDRSCHSFVATVKPFLWSTDRVSQFFGHVHDMGELKKSES